MGWWSKVAAIFDRSEPASTTSDRAFVELALSVVQQHPDVLRAHRLGPPHVRIVGWPNDATLHELERCAQPPRQRG